MKLRMLIAGLLIGVTAFAAEAGGDLFQKATTLVRAGNLEEAIRLYQRVATEYASDHDLAAKALLAEARCYETLGQDKAMKLYEQIARSFPDQKDSVAAANARLAILRQNGRPAAPATMTQRQIEMMGRDFGDGDTDGHRVVYMNRATGELIYGDLAGTNKRVIFKAKLSDLPEGTPSRDFSMVYLRFQSTPDQPQTIAIVNTDGTGYRQIARLDAQPDCWPSWSWDKRYLLCTESQDDTTRLVKISVADGKAHELLSLKTRKVDFANFSPDGRFVAYEVPASSDADPVSRIFVVPAEGGTSQPAYEESPKSAVSTRPSLKLLDWAADGRYLAIASELSGKAALYLLPIKDGKSAGAPIFVRYGDFESGATTAAGGLIYRSVKPGGFFAVQVAPLDANSRLGAWKRLDLRLGNTTNPWPQWSGDSSRIVYVTRNEDAGQNLGDVVHLLNLSTGEDREVFHAPGHSMCIWAAQQPKLFCSDEEAEKTDIVSIAIDSGQIERLHAFQSSAVWITAASRDDRALYMLRGHDLGAEVLRWEVATGQETKLEQFSSKAGGKVGPDERWLIRLSRGSIEIRPLSGGDWKTLVSLDKKFFTGHAGFTSDGNWLLYHDVDSAGKHGLFRIATTGGQPERLGDFPTSFGSGTLEISPDGSKVMVVGQLSTPYELWSLDNFVPAVAKK